MSFNVIKVGEDNSTLENGVFPGFLIFLIFYCLEGEGLFSSVMSKSHLAKCNLVAGMHWILWLWSNITCHFLCTFCYCSSVATTLLLWRITSSRNLMFEN